MEEVAGSTAASLAPERLMRRVLLSLLLLLASLGAGGRAYEVAELVEGRLGAEAANRYTVDVSGVLVGELCEQPSWS